MTLSIRIKLMAHVTFAYRKFLNHNFYSYSKKQTDQDEILSRRGAKFIGKQNILTTQTPINFPQSEL